MKVKILVAAFDFEIFVDLVAVQRVRNPFKQNIVSFRASKAL